MVSMVVVFECLLSDFLDKFMVGMTLALEGFFNKCIVPGKNVECLKAYIYHF